MYNLHVNPSIGDEERIMNKGRLVKARLPDQNAPNVDWYWIPTGNCHACANFARKGYPKCHNPTISVADFFEKWMFRNSCPGYEAGQDVSTTSGDPDRTDYLDVMKAVGLVPGKPSQRVIIIVDEPWNINTAIRAHEEQSMFLQMAVYADSPHSKIKHGESIDLSDDLERPTSATPPPP